MSSDFTITKTSETEGCTVLRVAGRLDAKTAQNLMAACQEARRSGRRRVLINLAEVVFVASSGIGTLLALTDEFREAGGGIHLVALSDSVRSVVDLLNLGQFLNVSASVSEALQSIGA